ncbi:MAG TPA: hypothetical protein VKV77_03545 [Methylovirgula sp.]|nr:hypothetical protein [Methylovirgula sp.]
MDSSHHRDRAVQYRQSAKERLSEASTTADQAVRPSLLAMALQWASLAEQAEKNANLVSELQ